MHTDELRPGPRGRRALPFSGAAPVTVSPTGRDIVERLRELAVTARRLPPPSARKPECFHEARDELGHDLEIAARLLERLLGLARR